MFLFEPTLTDAIWYAPRLPDKYILYRVHSRQVVYFLALIVLRHGFASSCCLWRVFYARTDQLTTLAIIIVRISRCMRSFCRLNKIQLKVAPRSDGDVICPKERILLVLRL